MITIAYDGSLKFDTKINTEGFTRGTNTIKTQANALKGTLASLARTVGLAFSLTALVAFGKQAIDTASDLQEVQNVVDTAFGDMAYKMEDFAAKSIDTFGISKLAAKQTGSTFMAMSIGMGIAMGTASDMSVSLTGLSADMASFYNVRQDVASTALKSIFTGETETLKQFGIVMTQTNLQAFAYSQGIKQNVSDMDQASITLLRYQYVMQQTALAQGDFAKTSDSWANQTRVLSERWKELLGILGNGLIQVLTPLVRVSNTALSYMITFANAASKVLGSVLGLSGATESVVKNTAGIAAGSEEASAGLTDMGKSAKKASKDAGGTAGFDRLNNMTENIAKNSSTAADSIGGIGGIETSTKLGGVDTTALEQSLQTAATKIKDVLQPAIEALDRLKLAVAPFAENVGAGLKWFFDNILIPFGTWTVASLIPAFLDTLGAAIGLVNSVIEVFKPYGLWLWDNFLQPIAAWTGGAIIGLLGLLTDGLIALSGWIMNNQETVANAALLIGSFFIAFKIAPLIAAIGPLLTTLGAFITSGGLLSVVLSGLSTVFAALTSPVTIIAAILGLLIYSFIDLYSSSESFRTAIAELGATWMAALQPLADFVSTVLSDAWNKILKPIIEFFLKTLLPQLISTFKNLWENVLVPLGTFIGTVLQPIFKALADMLTLLWENVVIPLAEAVGTVLKEAWSAIYEIMNKTLIPIFKVVIDILTKLWKKVINPIIDVLWDNFKPAFETVFGAIKTVINGLKDVMSGIIKFITGIFTGDWEDAWEGVKKIFKGIFDALVGIVKTPINLIIDIINGMIGGITTGINTVIKAANGLSFDMPDWLGGGTVGFSIPLVTAPKIPKLATGTVVPANYGEFLSILGDSRHPEIVSPIPDMKQAFKEALVEMGSAGSGKMAHFTIKVGNRVLFEGVVEAEKENYASTGDAIFVH